MSNIPIIEKFLSDELNLSPKEITLYLNLVKFGAVTILELSDLSTINRATTHVNVDSLTKKGLVTQIKKGRGSRRLIMAEPIEKLSIIIKERKAKIEAAEKQLGKIAFELSGLKKECISNNNIDIRRYVGKNEVKLIYDEVLEAKEIRTYANTVNIANFFPNNVQKFIAAHKKNRDMYIWEIMEDSIETRAYIKEMDPKRFFFRLTTKNLPITTIMDYLIFDGRVAMIETLKNTISGILIENKTFYDTSKTIHELVWKSDFLHDY